MVLFYQPLFYQPLAKRFSARSLLYTVTGVLLHTVAGVLLHDAYCRCGAGCDEFDIVDFDAGEGVWR